MTWINAAIGLVFICNVLFVVYAAVMLYRIVNLTAESRDTLLQAAKETHDGGVRLKDMVREAGVVLSGVMARAQVVAERPPPAPGPAGRGDGGSAGGGDGGDTKTARAIDELSDIVKGLAERGMQDFSQANQEAVRLVQSMSEVDGRNFDDWKRQHKSELDQALAQKHRLEGENEQVRLRLEEAGRVINDLRRENRTAATANEVADTLRAHAEQLQKSLDSAKERARNAEALAGTSALRIEQLQEQVAAAKARGGDDSGPQLAALKRRIDEMAAKEAKMQARLDEAEQAMQRTLVEKGFIEEKFVSLDRERAGEKA